jgi:hypothetical protein
MNRWTPVGQDWAQESSFEGHGWTPCAWKIRAGQIGCAEKVGNRAGLPGAAGGWWTSFARPRSESKKISRNVSTLFRYIAQVR